MSTQNEDLIPLELTGESPCPLGKKWKGLPLKDVEAGFLLWFYDQSWAQEKYPQLYEYVKKEYNELVKEQAEDDYDEDTNPY